MSQKIAESEGNPEFAISNAWLTQIEELRFSSQHIQTVQPKCDLSN
jgi:hypothetical protein